MDVLAYLPPLLLAHLRVVVASRAHRLHAVTQWAQADAILRSEPIGVAIVDPTMDGGWEESEAIGTLTRRFASLPVVIYTTLTPAALKGVVGMARQGVSQLILYRFDDDPGRFLELLEQLTGNALRETTLARLAPQLAALPSRLAWAVATLFAEPQRIATADDLARLAGVPRRTVYRVVEGAGLGTPSRLVKGAKLLQAYAFLRDAGYSLEDVARKCGFSSRQLFARHVRELSGMQPRELRRRVAPERFVEMLAAWLTTPLDEPEAS